jgi:alkanesulfonate monooxygenase SsuD/methylene tetrahydromethanopterin reductase-like flavin-dependent oxidoreductase (luciferase family)
VAGRVRASRDADRGRRDHPPAWEGGYVDHRGPHFAVEDARVFDLPEAPVPIALAASGSESVQLAARL